MCDEFRQRRAVLAEQREDSAVDPEGSGCGERIQIGAFALQAGAGHAGGRLRTELQLPLVEVEGGGPGVAVDSRIAGSAVLLIDLQCDRPQGA